MIGDGLGVVGAQYGVLRLQQTDRAGTGEYDEFFEDGIYVCAGCNTPLYTSQMKFACGCGWPGFWTNLPKAVRELPDEDGHRVEIVCNACNGHLGHVRAPLFCEVLCGEFWAWGEVWRERGLINRLL